MISIISIKNDACIFLLEITLTKESWPLTGWKHYSLVTLSIDIIDWQEYHWNITETQYDGNIITWQHQSWVIICRISLVNTHKHTHTHTHTHKTKNKQTDYTLCDVNTEDTIRHDNAMMTSTSRVYIPYPLGTIINWCHMKT